MSSKDVLLDAANRLFAQRGFTATTLREIAQEAGVNQALVNYHFESKEGLYLAAVERIGNTRLHQVRTLLTPAHSFDEFILRLKIFVEDFFNCCSEQPDCFRMLNRELEKEDHSPEFEKVFRQTLMQTFLALVEFISHAKEQNLLNPRIHPEMIASLIFSMLNNQVRLSPLAKKFFGTSIDDRDYREEMIEQITQLFTNGLTRTEHESKKDVI